MKFTNVAAIVALLAAGLCFADPRTPAQIEALSKAVATAIADNKDVELNTTQFKAGEESVTLEAGEADSIAASKDKTEKAIKAILTKFSDDLKAKADLNAKADAIVALDMLKFKEKLAELKDVDANRQKIILKLVDYEMLNKDNVIKVLQAETKALAALEADFKVEKLAKLGTVAELKALDKDVLKKVLTDAEITKLLAMDATKDGMKVDLELFKTFADTPTWFSLKNIAIGVFSMLGIAGLGALVYHFTRENTEEQTDL